MVPPQQFLDDEDEDEALVDLDPVQVESDRRRFLETVHDLRDGYPSLQI